MPSRLMSSLASDEAYGGEKFYGCLRLERVLIQGHAVDRLVLSGCGASILVLILDWISVEREFEICYAPEDIDKIRYQIFDVRRANIDTAYIYIFEQAYSQLS
ncbi:hypothetical protein TWF569_001426 [Orbilia oligospora]|uniref:Uncharacterized protein n=1 Tax=Orbilia oligospora TaxID=2813651 RepID=A0A7C8J1T8_ORBOL|nr:hypothetical protein TWF102_000543 [Orbilia oligospora]KAF3091826.1 hypothetical protein TWF706_009496 [Orbilia oligospora]KAF3117469.1 hypothetical protein TWF103_006208 [Orbilia oligospora]KAF3146943.1 hypothetical protein TWF594_002997 [Orbilia oligospora]KAF3153825.1 hypothetical protein TWF569_001426 [Orbilia oligospora]